MTDATNMEIQRYPARLTYINEVFGVLITLVFHQPIYQQFNPTDGKIRTITATWKKSESVEIDGKQYDTDLIELRGGVASQNVYVDTDESRILKITFEENNWTYELLNK